MCSEKLLLNTWCRAEAPGWLLPHCVKHCCALHCQVIWELGHSQVQNLFDELQMAFAEVGGTKCSFLWQRGKLTAWGYRYVYITMHPSKVMDSSCFTVPS